MKKFTKLLSACMLSIMVAVLLVGCIPANAEKAVSKMKEEGYSVEMIEKDYLPDDCEEGIIATDIEISLSNFNADSVTAYWFESKKAAKKYYEELEETSSTIKKRKGKCVYIGTADAIEDFEE